MLNKNVNVNDVDFLHDVYLRVMICTYNKNENITQIDDCFFDFYENVIKNQITFDNERDIYSFFALLYIANCCENDIKTHFHILRYLSLKIANDEHSCDECYKQMLKLIKNKFYIDDFDFSIDYDTYKTIFA